MKILHSADTHLREAGDERWAALKVVLETAAAQKVDALVFSGDFFDDPAAAERLRPLIREQLSGLPFPVIILPGNHDAEAYPDGAFWGERVQLLRDPEQPFCLGETCFWGLPFREAGEAEVQQLLTQMAQRMDGPGRHFLLFHGELTNLGYGWGEYGRESRKRYMPASLEMFEAGPWQAVLAGHLHRKFAALPIDGERYFIYPGSPVAITRNEIGRRAVNLLEDDAPPRALEIETAYYQTYRLRLDPLRKPEPEKEIRARVEALGPGGMLLVEASGFFNGAAIQLTEEQFFRKLKSLENERVELSRIECRDIRRIADDPLFRKIIREIQNSRTPRERSRQILGRILQAMME